MRELKFRVWHKGYKNWIDNSPGTHCCSNWMMDIYTGEMVDFVNCYSNGDSYSRQSEPNHYLGKGGFVEGSPFIVQQFTGLKDAQGNEIYEGDILKHDIGLGPIYWEVIWNSEAGQWQTTKEHGGNIGSWFDNYLVAGNIFENPELLK